MRNLQDPLAMRLWVLGQSYVGVAEMRKSLTETIIKQWEEEVKTLGKDAYHTRAAEMSWNLKALDLTEEQRRTVSDLNTKVEGQLEKPKW